jgi:hypothetical protein
MPASVFLARRIGSGQFKPERSRSWSGVIGWGLGAKKKADARPVRWARRGVLATLNLRQIQPRRHAARAFCLGGLGSRWVLNRL